MFVSKEETRLDKFLVNNLKNFSRAKIQNFIELGLCKVNGKVIKDKSFIVKNGDKIEIKTNHKFKIRCLDLNLKDIIVYQDENFLIINKPSGIVTSYENIKLKEQKIEDLEEFLKRKFDNLKKLPRAGIVHRLDKDVSGILIVSKHKKIYNYLKTQFKNREIKKEYLGLVFGEIKKDSDIIKFPLTRSKSGRIRIVKKNETGKEAITEFEVIERNPKFSFLKIFPLTGRTHQIRVHLASYGFPIVGDTLYTKKKCKITDRILLHSFKITFKDLKNKLKFFKVIPDEKFIRVIKKLGFKIDFNKI